MKIPKKFLHMVTEIEDDRGENNGWWIYLKDGYRCDISAAPHTIHENTVKECIAQLRETIPCFCNKDICICKKRE